MSYIEDLARRVVAMCDEYREQGLELEDIRPALSAEKTEELAKELLRLVEERNLLYRAWASLSGSLDFPIPQVGAKVQLRHLKSKVRIWRKAMAEKLGWEEGEPTDDIVDDISEPR